MAKDFDSNWAQYTYPEVEEAIKDKVAELEALIDDAGQGGGTVTGVKVNGTTHDPNENGVVDIGTVITQNQDISGKADKVTVVDVASTGNVSQSLAPNTFYKFGSIDSLALALTPGTGFVMYAGKFTASANWGGTELSVPATVVGATGNDIVEAGKVYEFSILDNVISVKEVA